MSRVAITFLFVLCCTACHRDMYDQPRYDTMEPSEFFEDGRSARLMVEGTVARGQLSEDESFVTGMADGRLLTDIPLQVDRELLERGRQRFNIFCSVCHGPTGVGNGMVVQRGFKQPPSFHIERLRSAPPGHLFDVITRGLGAMPSYSDRVNPRDRWAIVAYIRVLQLSQNATLEDVPPEFREQLESGSPEGQSQSEEKPQ